MDAFTGYPDGALELLASIGAHDREWFTAHKTQYHEQLLEPTKALVADLAPELHAGVSPGLQVVAKVNGSIAPITNDARFHAVPPYKDYVLLRFWEGPDKANSSMLFLRLSATGVGFGAGWRFAGSDVKRYRDAVAAAPGADLVAELEPLLRKPGAEIIGDELKRVPPGYDAENPARICCDASNWGSGGRNRCPERSAAPGSCPGAPAPSPDGRRSPMAARQRLTMP